jgi:hypothetical protein
MIIPGVAGPVLGDVLIRGSWTSAFAESARSVDVSCSVTSITAQDIYGSSAKITLVICKAISTVLEI